MSPKLLAFPLTLALAAVAVADAPQKNGPEFQVNTYTTNYQAYPSVASVPGVGFVVVWHSLGSDLADTDGYGILAQRYDAAGQASGAQLQVNGYTTGDQKRPHVAISADGSFVVVWHGTGSPGSDADGAVVARRFSSGGSPLGEIQVNTYTTGSQSYPRIAMAPNGDFTIVWQSAGSGEDDTSGTSIQGRRYASDGTAAGAQFQVNSLTLGGQVYPSVARDAGGFVVVWSSASSAGADQQGTSIQGRRYGSDGSPLDVQFEVNSHTPMNQRFARVKTSPGGGFVVTWTSGSSVGTDSDGYSIQARRFSSDGTASGVDFQVNTHTTGFQWRQTMLVDEEDRLFVAWCGLSSSGTDTSLSSVQGRIFDASDVATSDDFQVNTYTTESQAYPSIATEAPGSFVVVWDSYGSSGNDDSYGSIQGQRFAGAFAHVFSDGFESGDATAWSARVP